MAAFRTRNGSVAPTGVTLVRHAHAINPSRRASVSPLWRQLGLLIAPPGLGASFYCGPPFSTGLVSLDQVDQVKKAPSVTRHQQHPSGARKLHAYRPARKDCHRRRLYCGIGRAIVKGLARAKADGVVNGLTRADVEQAMHHLESELEVSKLKGVVADVGSAAGCAARHRPGIPVVSGGGRGGSTMGYGPGPIWQRIPMRRPGSRSGMHENRSGRHALIDFWQEQDSSAPVSLTLPFTSSRRADRLPTASTN